MKRRVCLAGIVLGLAVLALSRTATGNAGHLLSGSPFISPLDQPSADLPAGAPAAGRKVHLPIVIGGNPVAAPTPGAVNPAMNGYNVGCTTSGAVQVCAAVCSKYPAPGSIQNVYGRLYVNGVAQKGRTMTARVDLPAGPRTCTDGMDYTGLAVCGVNIGAAPRYTRIAVRVTIDGLSADTFFTPQ
jgi:hypothetical protein